MGGPSRTGGGGGGVKLMKSSRLGAFCSGGGASDAFVLRYSRRGRRPAAVESNGRRAAAVIVDEHDALSANMSVIAAVANSPDAIGQLFCFKLRSLTEVTGNAARRLQRRT